MIVYLVEGMYEYPSVYENYEHALAHFDLLRITDKLATLKTVRYHHDKSFSTREE